MSLSEEKAVRIGEYCWDMLINGLLLSRWVPFRFRMIMLKLIGMNVSTHSAIHSGCFFTGKRIYLGEGSYINRNCYIDCKDADIRIGNKVGIAPCVQIYTTNHDYSKREKRTGNIIPKRVVINDGVWIGGGTIVCPGVNIGKGCVIAAGSIVVKDCLDNCVYAGNPAKIIKKIKVV